ncbi:MAG: hypothetical protein J6U89_08800 [Bacteroidaceae bacterium]|nr:hypothetical protein [Bacteroidaceae bacterium]
MKTLLFPYSFKMWGWCVLTIGVAFGIYAMVADYGSSLVNNIAIIGTVIGAMFVTCSREKIEDEMVRQLRLNSLLVALYISYAVLIVCSLFVYGLDFLYVMIYNMFTILFIFMIVFRYRMWHLNKEMKDEEQD